MGFITAAKKSAKVVVPSPIDGTIEGFFFFSLLLPATLSAAGDISLAGYTALESCVGATVRHTWPLGSLLSTSHTWRTASITQLEIRSRWIELDSRSRTYSRVENT